jgi:hypothetical protein
MITDVAQRRLLSALFHAQEANPLGVNWLKFRADHDEELEAIDALVAEGFIHRQEHNYLLKLVGLSEVGEPSAESIQHLCRHLFDRMRRLYKQDPLRQVPLTEIAEVAEMPLAKIKRALPYLIEVGLLICT